MRKWPKKRNSVNSGLWFVCGCACCATSAPNLRNLRDLRRHLNPALTKPNPKAFPQYMRRAVENLKSQNCPRPK